MRYVDPDGRAVAIDDVIIVLILLLAYGTAKTASDNSDANYGSSHTIYGDDDIYHLGNSYTEPDFSKKKKSDSKKPSPLPEKGATSASPSPAPNGNNDNNNDDDDEKDYYESSPKHHPNSKSPEPKNAKEMFDRSKRDPEDPKTRWYKDKKGVWHRFQGQNHKYHWNGSTDTGKTPRVEDVPIDFRRQIPNGDI